MKIGMRNIKTALSVFLCMLIYELPGLDSPFYASIAAIIVMQTSVRDTFKAGKDRMLGTLLGALVGFLFALIAPGNPLLVALGIVIIIYISNLLGWNNSISISGVVFIAIMITMQDRSPVEYSLYRLIDTFIGIIVAVLVNYFIVPPSTSSRVIETCRSIVERNQTLVDRFLSGGELDYEPQIREIDSLSGIIEHALSEVRTKKSNSRVFSLAKQIVNLSDRIHKHLDMILIMRDAGVLNSDNFQGLKIDYQSTVERKNYVDNETNFVYNYHVRNVLEDMKMMNVLSEKLNT